MIFIGLRRYPIVSDMNTSFTIKFFNHFRLGEMYSMLLYNGGNVELDF
jgi:hypothetical protein